MWIEVLKRHVEQKGPRRVAQELGFARSTIDLVCQGKYKASTKRIEERVKAVYGHNGKIFCEVLGEITPLICAENWNKAKKIGMLASNPEHLRLYKTCLNCSVRKG
jgi:hypothetical protein